jgi:CheY-like chemotaxis protein
VRVLVVDDYAPMADHLTTVLRGAKYDALAVYSGEEALRVAEEFAPHALISDIMMPGMNGVELACAFGEKFPACRSLLMTATQLLPELFIRGLRIRVLEKPLDPTVIFEFLSNSVHEAPEQV